MRIFISSILLVALVSAQSHLYKRQAINVQNPSAWQALDQLRGSTPPTAAEVQRLVQSAVPGQSYPTLAYIPQTSFSCSNVRQSGFYADPETRCQVFRRCEPNNYMFSYICPNTTIYNQISLVCDYWYNVNCPNSAQFVDYSNPRIYVQNARLLDDGGNYQSGASGNLVGGAGPYSGGQQAGGATYNSGQSGLSGGSATYSSGQQQQPAPYSGPQGGSSGGAYTGLFSGSYQQGGQTQAQQQQLPYGTQPLQQTVTYPSQTQQLNYQPYSAPQAPAPYAPQQQPAGQPSYRSLSNRLLRLHADASDVVSTQVPSPASTPLPKPN